MIELLALLILLPLSAFLIVMLNRTYKEKVLTKGEKMFQARQLYEEDLALISMLPDPSAQRAAQRLAEQKLHARLEQLLKE